MPETLLIVLILLACPVGMGVAMWMISRHGGQVGAPGDGQRRIDTPTASDAELIRLRAELDQLRAAERERHSAPADQP
ncbi:MAG: hypothetical protein ACRDJ9_06080 [Dehalococcoidia bacterium]